MKLQPQHVLTLIGPPKSGKSTSLRDAAKAYAAEGLRVLFVDVEHTASELREAFIGTSVRVMSVPQGEKLEGSLGLPDAHYDVIVVDYAALLKAGLFDLARIAKERNCAIVTAQQVTVPEDPLDEE